jgi:alpha-glucosidase (family GH31 glycosyl hydrolase)
MKLDLTSTQLYSWQNHGGKLADGTKNYALEYHRAAYKVTQAYAAANDPRAMLNGARGLITPKQTAGGNDQFPGWWTDDTPTTWAGMTTEMGRAQGLNNTSTAAYWCGDTGGYAGKPTDELFIRWLEYTTFTPLQEYFGSKSEAGSIGSRFPWMFGTQAQTIHKKYTKLRYQTLPFRYSNALRSYLIKPVAYPVRWNGSKQIIAGQDASQILIQPITTAGATTATVALPTGTWINWWTDTSYSGTVTVPAPIDQVPMFVKAGSIIPTGPTMQWVDQKPADPLTLEIFPAGSTSYTLYEDDGMSQGYMGGAYASTTFGVQASGSDVIVNIGAQQTAKYHFSGQLCQRGYILKIHQRTAAPAQLSRDGQPVANVTNQAGFNAATEGWYYDSTAKIVWVKFPLSSSVGTSVSF